MQRRVEREWARKREWPGRHRAPAAIGAALLVLLMAFNALAAEAPASREYRLGSGDRLSIMVFGQKDLSGEFVVDAQGRLALPLIGQIEAKGLTVTQLQAAVTDKLEEYLVEPRVSIEVLNYRPFYIYGQVNKAGSYPFVSGVTIRQAVAIAGGFTRRARKEPVIVTREVDGKLRSFEADLDELVMPGDTIEVKRRLF